MSVSQCMLCCVVAAIVTIGAKMVTGSLLNSRQRDLVRLRERLWVLQAQFEGYAKHRKVVSGTHAFYETRRQEVIDLIQHTTHDLEGLVAELDAPPKAEVKEVSVHNRSNDIARSLA